MGCFSLNQLVIRDNPEDLAGLLAKVIVVKAEYAVHPGSTYNDIRYVAYSPLFEPLRNGQEIPEYVANFVLGTGFVGFTKLDTPQDRAKKKIIKQAELIKDLIELIANAPLSEAPERRVDVQGCDAVDLSPAQSA